MSGPVENLRRTLAVIGFGVLVPLMVLTMTTETKCNALLGRPKGRRPYGKRSR
jgi:hypothetical protein